MRRTLAALLVNEPARLIVYSDGPRPGDESAVAAVRKVIAALDPATTELVIQTDNLGLGRSVRRGVTEVLDAFPAAIVFEDDLVCVPGTYRYLCAALERYAHEPRVMSVTAWTHPRLIPADTGARPYFDGKAECWAWGTWRRAWREMDRPPIAIMRDCERRGVDIARYGFDMPIMAAEANQRNLWAVGWWYAHMLHDGLCLRPPRSFVEHVGWDRRGTTMLPTMEANWANPPLAAAPLPPRDWPHPVEHPACPLLWRRAINDTRIDIAGPIRAC